MANAAIEDFEGDVVGAQITALEGERDQRLANFLRGVADGLGHGVSPLWLDDVFRAL